LWGNAKLNGSTKHKKVSRREETAGKMLKRKDCERKTRLEVLHPPADKRQ
jgi:hypothetical protein